MLKTIDSAQTRSRAMDRALRKVEALPDTQAGVLIAAETGRGPVGPDNEVD